MAHLLSINISPGGIPKLPTDRVEVLEEGLAGDGRNHAKHNKPHRALSLLDQEILEELRAEGYTVGPGVLGENLTVKDLGAQHLTVGSRLHFSGGVVIELTEPRKPCFVLDTVDERLKETTLGRIGWMAKVVQTGFLSTGEKVQVESGDTPCR